MGLDFHKLLVQIQQVGRDSLQDSRPQEERARRALSAYCQLAAQEGACDRLDESKGLVLWPVCTPLEPINLRCNIDAVESSVTVVAVDGSQIMPSRHEIYSCYLLNIGLAIISYGGDFPPVLQSVPSLYHRQEDLYPLVDRRRVHIDELYVSLERNLLELETAAAQSIDCQSSRPGLPVICFLDGSLIPWSLEKMPEAYRQNYLKRAGQALELMRQANIPLVGYLSHSRSSDLVNSLRVLVCPYRQADCRRYCGHLNEDEFACSSIWPLADRQLMSLALAPGQRSAVFASGANMAGALPHDFGIAFSYIHVGYEVARIEFPRWLPGNEASFNLALAVTLAQVDKGMGYPVCLAEAHHKAVVRGQDRAKFFQLLERHLVEIGLTGLNVSQKEIRKRHSII